MTGAEVERRTEFGVRFTAADGGSHVSNYDQDETAARRGATCRPVPGGSVELVRRTVTYDPWTAMKESDHA